MVIYKINLGPCIQGTLDSGTQSVIGQQPLGHIRNQNWIADIGIAGQNFFNSQIVGQMTRANDFNAIVENKQANRRTYEIVPMHQGIDQQLFEHTYWNFWQSRRIYAASSLHLVQVAHDKSQSIIKYLGQRPGKILGIDIVCDVNFIAGISNGFYNELRSDPLWLFSEHQYACQIQIPILSGEIHVL